MTGDMDPDYIRTLHSLDLDPVEIADEIERLRSLLHGHGIDPDPPKDKARQASEPHFSRATVNAWSKEFLDDLRARKKEQGE